MAAKRVRTAAVGLMVSALALTAGCTGGTGSPSSRPEDAERAVQQLVDDSASALGGDWTVEEGPRLGTCTDERGNGEGVHYTILSSRAERGDIETDVSTLTTLWKRAGLVTERFTNGDGSYSGLNGRGAGIANIAFNSSDLGGGDTISATSECAAGDYVELREQERGQR